MSFLIVGASAGLGRELARSLAAAGHDLVLVASDERDVSAVAQDIAIRHGVRVRAISADMGGADAAYVDRVEAALLELGSVEGLLFPVGAARPDDDARLPSEQVLWLTRTNYLAVVALVSRLLPRLTGSRRGVIVGFGSVAALRGRAANVAYAAAKRALQSYFESLRSMCAGSRVVVQFYVVGYLATNQAVGPTPLPKGDPRDLARRAVHDLWRDIGTAYYPRWWRVVAPIVRLMPWMVFKRLRF